MIAVSSSPRAWKVGVEKGKNETKPKQKTKKKLQKNSQKRTQVVKEDAAKVNKEKKSKKEKIKEVTTFRSVRTRS